MIAGFRAVWRGLRHLNQRGYIYIWANVLWFALSLPLVTAPAAWAGLVKMSHVAHKRPTAALSDFWEGFRENLRRGLALFALNALVIGVNVSNLVAYAGQHTPAVNAARVVWVVALALWIMLQLYLWPLFYEMKQPTLAGALRNAALMMALNPLFTLAVFCCVAMIAALSTFFFAAWLLVSAGALAAVANSAVFDRLESAGFKRQILTPEAEASPSSSEWE